MTKFKVGDKVVLNCTKEVFFEGVSYGDTIYESCFQNGVATIEEVRQGGVHLVAVLEGVDNYLYTHELPYLKIYTKEKEEVTYKCIDMLGYTRDGTDYYNQDMVHTCFDGEYVTGIKNHNNYLVTSKDNNLITDSELFSFFKLVEEPSEDTTPLPEVLSQPDMEEDKYNLKGIFEANGVVLTEKLKADLEKQIGVIVKVECMSFCQTND